jgi:hypothetical protein
VICEPACKDLGGWSGKVTEAAELGYARTERDCTDSIVCARDHKCIYRNNECVVTDCRETAGCREHGFCQDADETDCKAGSDADCRASADCKAEGHCSLAGNGHCLAHAADDCAQSAACRTDGLCTYSKWDCIAGSDADCAQATTCTADHRCHKRGTWCQP